MARIERLKMEKIEHFLFLIVCDFVFFVIKYLHEAHDRRPRLKLAR